MFRQAAILLLALAVVGFGRPVYAADASEAASSFTAAGEFTVPALGAASVGLTPAQHASLARPAVLPALYAALAATEAFDGYSTQRGLANGARELNPLSQGGHAGFWTMKAIGTAVPIVLAERMWKTNKVAAIATMVVANGVMAAVAANNARVLAHQR
jgi:hypothetical protein